METWKDIYGYEGAYMVSNYGNVKSLKRRVGYRGGRDKEWKEKLLKQETTTTGYKRVCLCLNGIGKRFSVHRLVASAFIENRYLKPEVNHKDGNPVNNHVSNLEWCTPSENELHSHRVLGKVSHFQGKTLDKHPQSLGKVYQRTKGGDIVRVYSCASEVELFGFDRGHVAAVILGKRKTHKNFIWSR